MARAHINLSTLNNNLSIIKTKLKPKTKILAAVKANAYGHGVVEIARYLSNKVDYLAVATKSEALQLTQAGIKKDILIFAPVYSDLEKLIEQNISLTVIDEYSIELVEKAVRNKKAKVHLKVDTGMGRIGQDWQGSIKLAQKIAASDKLEFTAAWTHFASSDAEDKTYTEFQLENFNKFLAGIKNLGIRPKIIHSANSAAIFAYPESHFDMVRPGIALYGYHSSRFIESLEPKLKPILTLTAPIHFIKRVKKGQSISYSNLWHAPKDTNIASIRIGYADGYPRMLTGKAEVLYKNKLYPIAGRVCMDQFMVDLGDDSLALGERLTLFGPEHNAEDLAEKIDTISYNLLTSLSARVERVYE